MVIYSYVPLVAFLVNFFFWVYIFALDRRSLLNRAFLIFCGILMGWELFDFLIYQCRFSDQVLLQIKKLLSFFWAGLAISFLYFMSRLVARKIRALFWVILVVLCAMAVITSFTDLVFKSFIRYSWGTFAKAGPLYIPVLLILAAVAGYGIFLLFQSFYTHSKIDKVARKAKLVLLYGFMTLFVLLFGLVVLVPLARLESQVPVMSSSAFVVQSIFLFVAIFRYNFLQTAVLQHAYAVFAQISDGVMVVSGDYRIVELNQSAAKMLGKRVGQVKGESIGTYFPEGYFFEEEYRNREYCLKGNAGVRVVLCSQSKLRWAFSAKIIVMKDITEYQRIENALRESEARFRFLFEHAPLGVIYVDNTGKIIDANPKLLEILGSPSLEETKKINIITFPSLVESGVSAHFCRCLDRCESEIYEHYYTTKWGRRIYMRYYFVPVRVPAILGDLADSKQHCYGVLAIIADFTSERMAEEKLNESQQELLASNAAKDKFFSIIAHDLRNPLTAIISYTKMLESDMDSIPREKLFTLGRELNTTAENTSVFLENLLLWAKSQIGAEEFEPEEFFLSSVVEDVLLEMRSVAQIKEVLINNRVPLSLQVFADVNMVKTILRNLLSNAIKFSYIGGMVEVFAVSGHGFCTVDIVDRGIGIKPEGIDKLFQIDTKYSKRGTANEKGSGLGLILCWDFVEKNGGQMNVSSVFGEGATFSFTLPLENSVNRA